MVLHLVVISISIIKVRFLKISMPLSKKHLFICMNIDIILIARDLGHTYLPTIALLSLISASGNDETKSPEGYRIYNHSYYWTETRANRNAADYFGRYYGVNWSSDHYFYKGSHRTIIDGFPF